MVPVQTIFALLALLVMMSSCSQVAPPHPGTETTTQSQTESKNNSVNPVDPPININAGNVGVTGNTGGTGTTGTPAPYLYTDSETFLHTTTEAPVSGTLTLWGSDAEKIYRLLSITPVPSPNALHPVSLLKQGSQFSCERKSPGYTCQFLINYADGSAPEVITREQVSYFDADLTQVAGQTNFLRIADPAAAGKKVRVFVPSLQAQMIYDALQVSEITLIPNATYSAGSQKDGAGVRCLKQTKVDGGAVLYSCYLYLDVSVGSIDKPTVGSL